jgi:glutamate-1-semialdehyde 2,1-aminomutase
MSQQTRSEEWATRMSSSLQLHKRASQVFPSGVNHDVRSTQPFRIYISKAEGYKKWDVDGNEFIDYSMGSGSLLLGHAHADVVDALSNQIRRGTQYGIGTPAEVEWGEWVQRLVPSAEQVRFVNSGTEATMLALRIARASTGKAGIIRFEAHYHGWHDYAQPGSWAPFQSPPPAGIPVACTETITVIPPNDARVLESILASNHDIAAVIVEASGAHYGMVPLKKGFLQEIRRLTSKYGVLMIMDEIITGFRFSVGGVQQLVGVDPDLTCLGKVVAGGVPGGAVAGKSEVMNVLVFTGDSKSDRFQRVFHGGTFNANPLASVAGLATLKLASTGAPQAHADRIALLLREGLAAIIEKHGLNACVYGESSTFHLYFGSRSVGDMDASWLGNMSDKLITRFRQALQLRGVDIMSRCSGVTSWAHTEEAIQKSLGAFAFAMETVRDEGLIASV